MGRNKFLFVGFGGKFSLRTKFIFVFLFTVLIITLLTGYISYRKAALALEDQLGRRLMSIAKTGVLMVDGDLHATLQKPEDQGKEAYNSIKEVLRKIRDENEATYVYTMALAGEDKVVFVVDAEEQEEDMSFLGDEYEGGIEPEMERAFAGEACFTKGMYTDEWGTFKTGYAPVMDSQGQVVAILGVDLSADEILQEGAALRQRYYFAGGAGILFGIVFSVLFAGYLTSPLRRMVKTMADIADMKGDLTQEIKVKSKDEIGEMAAQFNRMLANLRGLLRQFRNSSNLVASTSANLSNSVANANQATDEIVAAISNTVQAIEEGSENQRRSLEEATQLISQFNHALQQVTSGAVEQAANVNESSLHVQNMAEEIEQIANNSQVVALSSEKTTEAAQTGTKVISNTIEGMDKIREIVQEAAKNIQDLGARSQQIGEIIQVIDDIAEQTNLLALNAAIEAARAGEHGKGFAVVADEVRKLAERSSKSTKEISNLVVSITQGIDGSVKAMDLATSEVDSGFELASEAGKVLNEILSTATTANEQIQKIGESTKKVYKDSKHMVESISSLAAIAEENSAVSTEMAQGSDTIKERVQKVGYLSVQSAQAVREVATSGEGMRDIVKEIAGSAESLALMARELEAITNSFKLD